MLKTKLVIMAMLHSLHNDVPSYSLLKLKQVLKQINPDVICAELNQEEIKTSKLQKNKIEYNVILPYAKESRIDVFGMEPVDKVFDQKVTDYLENQKQFREKFPERYKVWEIYQRQLLNYLTHDYWTEFDKVQSQETDNLFRLKHEFQNELMGTREKEGWDYFNNVFANKISEISQQYKGKKVLVTIGAEHVYWLKEKLKHNSEFELIEISK
ncbi:MAG: hypothetical protein AB7I27_03115 [Bacteriovoracaceae bacterium]